MKLKASSTFALTLVLLLKKLINCQRHSYYSQPVHSLPVHTVEYGQPVHPVEYGHCLEKVCEQTITGRGLPYSQILHIIHRYSNLKSIHSFLYQRRTEFSERASHNYGVEF